MDVKITLFEYDEVGETGKTLQITPRTIETDVMFTIYDNQTLLGNIVVDINLLLKALRKIEI